MTESINVSIILTHRRNTRIESQKIVIIISTNLTQITTNNIASITKTITANKYVCMWYCDSPSPRTTPHTHALLNSSHAILLPYVYNQCNAIQGNRIYSCSNILVMWPCMYVRDIMYVYAHHVRQWGSEKRQRFVLARSGSRSVCVAATQHLPRA